MPIIHPSQTGNPQVPTTQQPTSATSLINPSLQTPQAISQLQMQVNAMQLMTGASRNDMGLSAGGTPPANAGFLGYLQKLFIYLQRVFGLNAALPTPAMPPAPDPREIAANAEVSGIEQRDDGRFYLEPNSSGQYVIDGTEGDDRFDFRRDDNGVYYTSNHTRIYLDPELSRSVIVRGKDGNDRISAWEMGPGFQFFIDGGAGDDFIQGSRDNDFIVGGEGTDDIWGEGGTDVIDITGDNGSGRADKAFNGGMNNFNDYGSLTVLADAGDTVNQGAENTDRGRQADDQTTVERR